MRIFRAFFLVITVALPNVAQANLGDIKCDDTARLRTTLTGPLGAQRQAGGLRDPETMLEIWVTRRDGDWMIVQNYANGTSCIVAMGEYWEEAPKDPTL